MNVSQMDKRTCCGCGVCSFVCCTKAISMQCDEHGFLYPVVEINTCIDCGVCIERCTARSNNIKRNNVDKPKVYAAWLEDEEDLLNSSSGGIFYALAKDTLEHDGYVSGAVYLEGFRSVVHSLSNQIIEVNKMRGSKYCQSDKKDIYLRIKKLLEEDESVLFTGLPCEVAGLKNYLSKDYEKLLCVDLICHGPAAPRILNDYIDYLEDKHNARIESFTMRNKKEEWLPLYMHAEFDNGTKIQEKYYETYHGRIFGSRIALRPSCYQCIYKGLPLLGDISIGDFKGIEDTTVNYNKKGVSVALINNLKGSRYFQKASRLLITYETSLESVVENNKRLVYPTLAPLDSEQEKFWSVLNSKGLEAAVNTLPRRKLLQRIIGNLKRTNT